MDFSEHGKPYEADTQTTEEIKVYVFGSVAAAEAFKLTAFYFGGDAKRIGSVLVMTTEAYQVVIDNTYATPATVIAVEEAK